MTKRNQNSSLLNLILDQCYNIDQTDINDNIANFMEAINPSLPLAIYFHKQEKCQYFAADANVPISKATMITTRTNHALQYGHLVPTWCEWCLMPANQQTWQQWKLQWAASLNKKRYIQNLTNGGDFNIEDNIATETRIREKVVDSLSNLANAAVQKNDTVGKNYISNKTLTDSIVSLQAHNLKLSKLAKKLTVGTPEVANLSKYDKLPWDPTD